MEENNFSHFKNKFNSNYEAHNINEYCPPQYNFNTGLNNMNQKAVQSQEMNSYNNIPCNFSLPTNNQITNKLIQIDNRISHFSQYLCLLYTLLILCIFSFLTSIFYINSYDIDVDPALQKSNKNIYYFEVINFFVNFLHLGSFFYGIQAFTKQNHQMNNNFEKLLIGLITTNFIYFFLFIFVYHVYFITWCLDIFFLILNSLLYYQAKDLTILFWEKIKLKRDDYQMF